MANEDGEILGKALDPVPTLTHLPSTNYPGYSIIDDLFTSR